MLAIINNKLTHTKVPYYLEQCYLKWLSTVKYFNSLEVNQHSPFFFEKHLLGKKWVVSDKADLHSDSSCLCSL